MNSFFYYCATCFRSFFGGNRRLQKNLFEINWHPQFLSHSNFQFQGRKMFVCLCHDKNIFSEKRMYLYWWLLRFIFEMSLYFFKGIIWSLQFFLLMDSKHQLVPMGRGGSAVLWSIPLTTHVILSYLNILVYSFPILPKSLVINLWDYSMQIMPNG